MDKIAERKGDLAKKQQALDDKKTEIRSLMTQTRRRMK